jgi:hypothetical protein
MTHPITPPPDLVQQWRQQVPAYRDGVLGRENWLMSRAAQWGADHELEACCDALDNLNDGFWSEKLRTARRPKPPSLKEQALAIMSQDSWSFEEEDIVRRALEQLDD